MIKRRYALLLCLSAVLSLSCGVVRRHGETEPPAEPESPAAEEPAPEVPPVEEAPGEEPHGRLEEDRERITVGLILPLTGELSGFGQAILEGALIARNRFEDAYPITIEFRLLDNRENYRTGSVRAIEIARQLRTEGVSAVIGPLTTPSVVATALTLEPDSVLILSPTASVYDLPPVAPNTFSLNTPSPSLSREIARFAVMDMHLSRFAILYPEDPYGRVMTESFIEEVERDGGRIMITRSYSPDRTTFEDEIKTVAVYAPDALFIPARSEDVIQIAPQIPYYGIGRIQLLGADGWNYEDVARKAGVYVEGAYFCDSFLPESPDLAYQDFAIPYIERYRKEPTRVAGWGYDALSMIVEAFRKGGAEPPELLRAFRSADDMRGATAVYRLVDGRLERKGFLFTITGSEIVSIEPDVVDSLDVHTDIE
jgi:branched-chain amino acid transport system substrate-binding protein